MNFTRIARISRQIDALSDAIGRKTAWLVLVVIVLLFAQLPLRELVGGGHILANDMGQIFHASVFMFGLSYALRWDRHVRMDVFFRQLTERKRAAINLAGSLLLVLPWCGLMVWYGWSIMLRSAGALELFPDTWSPGYFVFKVLLVVCMALLGLQAVALAARSIVALTDKPGVPL